MIKIDTKEKRIAWWEQQNLPHPLSNPEINQKRIETLKKHYKDGSIIPWSKGIPMREETKQKLSKIKKGKRSSPNTEFKEGFIPWNKGKKGYHIFSKEELAKKSEYMKLYNPMSNPISRAKAIIGCLKGAAKNKGRKLTKEHIRKCLRRQPKSSLEKKFEEIINKYSLPYKFVGNGDFFIERLNPDFININGNKICVEVFAKKFKEIDGRTIKNYKNRRIKICKKYGWEVIFFDETEVNEDLVLIRLNSLKKEGD